ncbi:MAG TPA: methionine--tRNA ligase [Anaerolineae bacterium]|nr:methionine--tRNA ligase [Anaerolineae bacterium]
MPDNHTPRYLVCVAWPYASGDRHLGHVAGAYLPPDIFARYQRLRGHEVLMVSGSDTHGTPVMLRAQEEGVAPKAIVDYYHGRFVESFRQLGLSFDLFTHTDTQNHWDATHELFLNHLNNGYIYKDRQLQPYCLIDQQFLADRYIEGECPICGYPHARGDQCDHCGNTLDPVELINPHCKICGQSEIEFRETEHFFFDLGKASSELARWLNEDKAHWRSHVINYARQQAESGELRGRAVTRDIDWGINVPVPGYEDKVIYVWYDAVIGYLSATREAVALNGEPEAWKDWWFDKSVKSYYFIGKDNIPFHAIFWPAMLIADGRGMNLPYDVPANAYLNIEDKKISTSRRWTIDLPDFLSRYDPDPLRYALTINAPETRDVNFTWEEFLRRNNDELVATWGNLVNRTLGFAYKRFDKRVPAPGEFDDLDRALLKQSEEAFERVGAEIDAVRLKIALSKAMELAHAANRYLNEKAPWAQIKTDPQAAATTIYVTLQVIDRLKVILHPFLPFTTQQLHHFMGYDGDLFGELVIEEVEDDRGVHKTLRYDGSGVQVRWEPATLTPGQPLRKPHALYKKLDPKIVEEERERLLARLGASA